MHAWHAHARHAHATLSVPKLAMMARAACNTHAKNPESTKMRPSACHRCGNIVRMLAQHISGLDQHRLLSSCSDQSSWSRYSFHTRWLGSGTPVTRQTAHTLTWPVAAAQQLWHYKSLATTSEALDQQQYWQAIEEYAAHTPAYWQQHLRAKDIEPLSVRQQSSRSVVLKGRCTAGGASLACCLCTLRKNCGHLVVYTACYICSTRSMYSKYAYLLKTAALFPW